MLGFKLESPRREDNVQDKTHPIYLDMQAGSRVFISACMLTGSSGHHTS